MGKMATRDAYGNALRDLVKDHYEFEMIYKVKEGGIRNVYIRIPNEKEAFELLATIPFDEE